MRLKLFVALSMLLVSSYAAAVGVMLGGDTKVKRIRMFNESSAVIYTSGQTGKASCAANADGFVLELGSGDLANRYYSAVLTAFAAGKVINMWCPDECLDAYGVQLTRCLEISLE